MSAAGELLVVVVAYRSDELLPRALSGVAGFHVVVVDNEPSPRTRRIAEQAGATYVAAPRNVGFAAGVNLALDAGWDGRADVLLLNPDAEVDGALVERLQSALRAPGRRLAAVAPALDYETGIPQRVEWPFPSPAQLWCEALGASRWWRGATFVIGAVLLLNGEALAQVGTFDERYFLYAEETDWQLRAHRAGWSNALVGDVRAIHVGAASSGDLERREQLSHASAELFARRWYGTAGWQVMRAAALVAALRRTVTAGRSKRRFHLRTARRYLRGPVRDARAHGAPI